MLLAATRHTRRNAVSFQRFVIHLLDKLDPSSSFLFFFKFFVRQLGDGHDFLHLVNPSPPLSSFSSITKGMIIIIKKKSSQEIFDQMKKEKKTREILCHFNERYCVAEKRAERALPFLPFSLLLLFFFIWDLASRVKGSWWSYLVCPIGFGVSILRTAN